MHNQTLLHYPLSSSVKAFSTTRLSPFALNDTEIKDMGTYAAFNVTDYCGDDPKRVARNQAYLCEQLHISPNCLWLPHQTHTANVHCIDDAFLKLSREEQRAQLNEIDALITNIPNQCIGISTADCVPILLLDEAHQAIAAIHAGWKGTVGRIVQRTLEAMTTHYLTDPQQVKALIGPSISLDAFEVGDEVVKQFLEAGFPTNISRLYSSTDALHPQKSHIDLWAANTYLLEESGVNMGNIYISGICTYQSHDSFFSARRLGINSGRIFTGIMLQPSQP